MNIKKKSFNYILIIIKILLHNIVNIETLLGEFIKSKFSLVIDSRYLKKLNNFRAYIKTVLNEFIRNPKKNNRFIFLVETLTTLKYFIGIIKLKKI